MTRVSLPKIGKRRPLYGKGWTYQVITLSPYRGFKRGYVKIFSPSGECVDRTLTVTAARKWYKRNAQNETD